MARKRFKSDQHPGELNLTAMIDVAFQLLSFFLITIKPVDVLAHLQAFRPSPEKTNTREQSVEMIKIMVLPNQYVMNEIPVTKAQLEQKLKKYADTDASQTILIMVAKQSKHEELVELLDKCAQFKLTNLSVVSSAGI